MLEHNNRKKADRLAEYITGTELRRYLAAKVEQYCGQSPSVFDGAAVVHSQTAGIGGDVWEIPREPAPEAEAVDIDEINRQLDEMALGHLKNHLEKQLTVIEFFNAPIDYLGFIGKVERLCQDYASRYRAYLC